MHRSGTSLLTKLLHLSGLYLGQEQDLLAANSGNPEGHWEHERILEINEELLAEFGGGWDYPPDLSGLRDRRRVARLEQRARVVLAQFAESEIWGWKDPRNSLTLPFWRPLVGRLHVVVCVRNPLEVALSLRRRNGSTIAFGLALWSAYNEALMRTTVAEERIVTHYARYLADPVAESARVGGRVGLALSDEHAEQLRQSTKTDLRHSRFSLADLVAVNVSTHVIDQYRSLCAEADWPDETMSSELSVAAGETRHGSAGDDVVGRFDYAAMQRLLRLA